MIGSGIFIVPAEMARHIGSAGWLLVAWGVAGALTIAGALCYGELSGMMPHAGGMYVYLREAYSPLWGFLYGWTLFSVIETGTIAAVAVAFARFSGVLWPSISEDKYLIHSGSLLESLRRVAFNRSTARDWRDRIAHLLQYSRAPLRQAGPECLYRGQDRSFGRSDRPGDSSWTERGRAAREFRRCVACAGRRFFGRRADCGHTLGLVRRHLPEPNRIACSPPIRGTTLPSPRAK